jgi:hypothetical protein
MVRRFVRFVVAVCVFASSVLIAARVAHAQCPVGAPVATLTDSGGYAWDVSASGAIVDGSSNAFDHGMMLKVNGTYFPSSAAVTELSGRQIVIGPATMGGLSVRRKVHVPTTGNGARFLDLLTNPSSAPMSVTVRIETNLGSDAATVVTGTSSGDAAFAAADRWIATDDGSDGTGIPAVRANLWGDGGSVTPAIVGTTVFTCNGTQGTFAEFSLLVPAGATRALLYCRRPTSICCHPPPSLASRSPRSSRS